MGGVVLNLGAQPPHIDRKGVVVNKIAAAVPQRIEDRAAGQGASGVAHKQAEQPVLGRRELEQFAAAGDPAGREVDADFPAAQHRRPRRGRAGPAQQRPQPAAELAELEGLGHVIVPAAVQPADDVDLLLGRSQKEDRGVAAGRAQRFAEGETATVGQADVQHQDIEPGHPAGPGPRLRQRGRTGNFEPLFAERPGQPFGQRSVVLE